MKNYYIVFAFVISLVACASTPKKSQNDNQKSETPKILKPIVKKIWIPSEIRNGGAEWIEGHYMYRIEKETSWSR